MTALVKLKQDSLVIVTSESEVAEHYSKLPRILGWLPSGLIIYWLLLGDYSDPHQSRP